MALLDLIGLRRIKGYLDQKFNSKINSDEKGAAGGVATLDENGHVLSSQLPSYVDDILEFPVRTLFPNPGENGKIYVDLSTNLTYRWGGTNYVEVSPSLAIGETAETAFAGNRGVAVETAVAGKAERVNTVLDSTLSGGRNPSSAVGVRSIAFGYNVTASGNYAQAFGYNSQATGANASAEGNGTMASGNYSHAEGLKTNASGLASHAENGGQVIEVDEFGNETEYNTEATGAYSHAEGLVTRATGQNSHSEGVMTQATEASSHAEGGYTIASGKYSHAGGLGTVASLNEMTAIGAYNAIPSTYPVWVGGTLYNVGDCVTRNGNGYKCKTANSDNSFVASKWDKLPSNGDTAFAVGNGTNEDNRSTAFKVGWDGKAYSEGNKELAKKEDMDAIVMVQNSEPTEDSNEIWFPSVAPEEITVPTYADFQDLAAAMPGQIDAAVTEYFGQSGYTAREQALKSEGYAVGTQDGTAVASDSPYYENNAKYWNDRAEEIVSGAEDAIEAKGAEVLDSIPQDYTDLSEDVDELKSAFEEKIGDDWNSTTQTITPTSSATAGYAYFSPVEVGSSISLSTNAGHSYYTYNNLTPGKTYHFKTYANTTWNNNHVVFANSSNKVTGYAIGQQTTAGSVEADITVPADTTLTYVICNKGTSDTATSVVVTIYDIVPLTTDVKNIREAFDDVESDVQGITTAIAGDVDKALSPKTVTNGKVTEWQFKELGGGSNTEERYESVSPVDNSTATGRTNATVGSTVSFGTQTDWYHVKFSAEPGSYRGTYFSSNSTKYNNIVAVDSSEKVLAILNDTPSGSGVITKTFTAPTNTAAIYLCCYGDIGRASTALMLEKAVDMTDSERLDNVEKQITSATANLTKSAVVAYMTNVTYTDGDYSTSAVTGYINNPKKIYREDIPNPVVVRWNPIDDAVSITVTIGTVNSPYYGRDISYEVEPTASSLAIYNLIPNTTYYYQVTAILSNGISAILSRGSVTTANSIVRMLNIDGIVNVRDIGGKTVTGGTVKYGMVYRGSEIDGVGFPSSEALGAGTGACILTDNGKLEMLNHIGIRAELDLRAGTYTKSAIAPTIDFACVGFPFYENVLTGDGLTALKTAFDFIVSEASQNRPVYMHCSGGNDRTGTLVTCLLGLLGVSENDLSKEYEISSFTFGQSRLRNSNSYNYKGLMAGVLALTGDTLADKFETLFTNASVSSANIASFRSTMIAT